ncbi:recombinase family protein [Desulfotomaculum sp. 1211_IL3151]|uniref:recombinase family protein n=1 Tax=Desulfotomaculum sp. 1211_IL3151 TaxID=3084055 RepID=UPI002FDB7C2A
MTIWGDFELTNTHDASEQIIVKNTHEALITQEQWDMVQELHQRKRRTPMQMDEPNLFSGLVFCMDCQKPLVLTPWLLLTTTLCAIKGKGDLLLPLHQRAGFNSYHP